MKKCLSCTVPPRELSRDEQNQLFLRIHPSWFVSNDKVLTREFAFVNFRHTMDFVNGIADAAEEEGHHPVLHVAYGKCIVELKTQSLDDITLRDFDLAVRIDAVFSGVRPKD